MKQARGAHPKGTRLAAQALAEGVVYRAFKGFDLSPINLVFLHSEGQGRLVDSRQLLAKERLVSGLSRRAAALRHHIAIRHRRRKLRLLTQHVRANFVRQHRHRRGVIDQVVEAQPGEPALVVRVFGIIQRHQRGLAQVQRRMLFTERPNRQSGVAPHHLHRLFKGVPHQAGAQDIVAVDHLLQGLGKRVQLLAARKAEHRMLLVGVALVSDVVVKQPFLQGRQRVDFLHVGGATGDAGDDALKAGRVEIGECEHIDRDLGTTRRNPIGRHVHIAATGDRCQRGERRLAEQHLHVGMQACLTHALYQLHRQQRVPAQLEEMVMPPDRLHLQQLGPDLRQSGFHALARRLEQARDKRRLRGCWQGLAVEFAVGGQG